MRDHRAYKTYRTTCPRRKQLAILSYLATKPAGPMFANSQSRLKVALNPKQPEVSSQQQPLVATGEPSRNADSSQLAILASTLVDELLNLQNHRRRQEHKLGNLRYPRKCERLHSSTTWEVLNVKRQLSMRGLSV